jgi:hypothetical protein
MRTTYSVGAVVACLLAFGAVGMTPAVAASKFLLGGSEITATTSIKMTPLSGTKFLLEDVGGTQVTDLLCSGSFEGAINAGGTTGSFTLMEMFNGELLIEMVLGKEGDDIECEDVKKICNAPVLLVALNFIWRTKVELATILGVERYLFDFMVEAGKEPEFYVDCNTALGLVEDYCKGLLAAELKNEAGAGVLAEFSENEEITPPLNCTIGGEKKGLLGGSLLITERLSNIELAVSE